MCVNLIGLGGGSVDTLTYGAITAMKEANLMIGAKRLVNSVQEALAGQLNPDLVVKEAILTKDIVAAVKDALAADANTSISVVFSGDTGFYSGASSLHKELKALGIEDNIFAGLSSIQMFSAALGEPWQNWKLCSAHGRECNILGALRSKQPCFFLTGGELTVPVICKQITEAGLGDVEIAVGERLSYPDQRIVEGTAKELAKMEFKPLCVMRCKPAPGPDKRTSGYPDEAFTRGKVPMTKQDVRAAVLSRMAIKPDDICWDVGAGTGSCSVEMALAADQGHVYAVECNEEGVELIKINRERFMTWNLSVIAGKAPEALEDLPAPDAVFIGGSKGNLKEIVDAALEKNPYARICISSIALETLAEAITVMSSLGFSPQITQIAVSTGKPVAHLHLMMANNPIFLISAQREPEEVVE